MGLGSRVSSDWTHDDETGDEESVQSTGGDYRRRNASLQLVAVDEVAGVGVRRSGRTGR